LKNPEIILLDEPTSALDSTSEEAISRAFERLFEWKTVLIIAHRLKTVQQVDTILVIEEGWIAEEGTHENLSQAGGIYARMLAAQIHF
jgi:ABC-type multidrug transport system fused ATPase/permease subunit